MNKNTNFTGQPIFTQILKLISRSIVASHSRELSTDRYYKRFKTNDHLVTMLYAIFHRGTSLRELTTGLLACQTKISHLGLLYSPRKSTISEANLKRNNKVFEKIYMSLYQLYGKNLPDSRKRYSWKKRLYIADSTTIRLFKEILKNAGRTPINGKRKGGVKVHTLIKSDQDVPCLARITSAAANDVTFLQELNLPEGSIITFDKGYNDYQQYERFSKKKINWITRIRSSAVFEEIKKREISQTQMSKGVLFDKEIILGHTSHRNVTRTRARLIKFYDQENEREFEFITNNFKMQPLTIALIYKRRWQIEILFKRIKQNFPLQYFLGDNENAIKIQIWCALIADLLIKVIMNQLKRKWSFSNLTSMIIIHLMTYTSLIKFLENPEKYLVKQTLYQNKGPTLF